MVLPWAPHVAGHHVLRGHKTQRVLETAVQTRRERISGDPKSIGPLQVLQFGH